MHGLPLALIALATAVLSFAPPAVATDGWTWPVAGELITPYRNGTDPYASGQHRGIDIGAPVGTPVVAAAAGEVRFAGTAGSNGLTVSIRTADGYDTSYLHLSALSVPAGAAVSAGDRLGAVGTTGSRSAEAPHLHFGVREAGSRHAYIDPLTLLGAPPAPAPAPRPAEPQPAPAPPLAVPPPAPAPAPGARSGPPGAPAPRRAPARRAPALPRSPAFRRGPARREAPALHRSRGEDIVHAPAAAPRSEEVARSGEGRTEGGRPARSVRRASGLASGAVRAGAPAAPPRDFARRAISPSAASGRPAGDPALGWAAACAGLLLAAAVLGLTEDGRRATARSRTRIAAALRPLWARR